MTSGPAEPDLDAADLDAADLDATETHDAADLDAADLDAAETPGAQGDLVGRQVELDVERVAHGGLCVARYDGRAVFVRHALPGERVLVTVTEQRARYLRADAVQVIVPSPHRVPAPCALARPGGCGGCDWQHAEIGYQRELKAAVLTEQLARLAGVSLAPVVEAVPGDDAGLSWRTRIRFAVRRDGVVGLRRNRSHDVEPVAHCPIAAPGVTAVGATARRWPRVSALEVIAPAGGGRGALIVTPTRRGAAVRPVELDAPVSIVRDDGGGRMVPVRGRASVTERAVGRSWRVSGSGFWQVHPGAADTLAGAVAEAAEVQPGDHVLDLYAGVGLFSAVLAKAAGPAGLVVAVESDESATADAATNLADLPNIRVLRGRVKVGAVGSLVESAGGRADVVVLDPPRSGAGRELCAEIAAARPRRVVYVACDPAALARDVAAFAAAGYHLAGLRAFDLFPMTGHLEAVAAFAPA